jgi:phosphohistidine phosphatase
MATLFLLRHAKAEKAAGGMKDFDRPLAARGRSDIAGIGSELASRFALPQKVLCSSSRRTRETLSGLGLPFKDDHVVYSRSLYEAEADGYLEELRAQDGASVMLIGHNPAMEELAQLLSGGAPEARRLLADGFPTSGLAVFEVEGGFLAIAPDRTRLLAFLTPERG